MSVRSTTSAPTTSSWSTSRASGCADPVPLARALALADQILDALDAAHRRGIVHRDLKPGNILLTENGVKVLDFGLAKVEHAPAVDSRSHVETQAASLTAEGSMLGTLPYMSPEQVEGHEADARSDIFAFGVVLYELIAGTRPFTGKTQANLVASILKEEPRPLFEMQPRTPRGLAEVVRTCLEKDPEKRWQSARDVRHALRWMAAEPPSSIPARSVRVWQWVAVLMAAIALGIGAWVFRPTAPGSLSRFETPVPENVTPYDDVSVSPDGRKLVFAATAQGGLWLRDFDALEWRRLPGTEGASTAFLVPRQPVRGLHSSTTQSGKLIRPAVHRRRWLPFPTPRAGQGPGIRMATSCWGVGAADRAVRCGECPRQVARPRR